MFVFYSGFKNCFMGVHKMLKLGFIGSGKMAQALINCLEGRDYSIIASDKNKDKIEQLKKELSISLTNDNNEVINKSDIIFICVKPQDMGELLVEIQGNVEERHLIVSIAAGISLGYLQELLPNKRVVRVMPNILCSVGGMAAAFSAGEYATQEDIKTIEGLLNSAGISFLVEEKLLDAVTALSGSGPAFMAFIVDLFIRKGKELGLEQEVSKHLALQTMSGTSKMLIEKNMEPEELISMVASPGGTTFAGLEVLQNSDIEETIKKTMEAAVKKSKELEK